MRLFFLGLITLMLSSNLHAWQLNLQTDDSGETFITVSSSKTLTDVQVYLTWFNLDTTEVQSWTIADGWQTGVEPITDAVVSDVTPFAEQVVAVLPASCDSTQNCFISFIAAAEGADATDSTQWQAGTVLPLTAKAGQARLAGQQFFLPITASKENNDLEAPIDPSAGSVFSGGVTSSVETEKPNVTQLVGQYLYYANLGAERLQVIDLSDMAAPRLLAEQRLENVGTPRELYVLNERVVLLQDTEQGLRISVWQLSADQQLQVLSQQELAGGFITSRRRDNVIYAALTSTETVYLNGTEITTPEETCRDCFTQQNIDIYAIQVTEDGQLTVLGQTQLPSYGYGFTPKANLFSSYFFINSAPKITIFDQYLVLISRQPQNWRNSLIQMVSLADESQPLRTLPTIQLAGAVDSEFQFQISDDVLKVLYEAADSTQGISLAVFDLSSAQPSLIGQLASVVLDETLQSARFVGDNIFLMTQQTLDNVTTAFLRVINVAEPSAPSLLSSTPLPMEAGNSDQLFFNDTRLLSVGLDTVQTAAEAENKTSVARMSLSLFDTSDPTNPSLISHFVPLKSELKYSNSLVSQDEQALLLDWEQAYGALPLTARVGNDNYGLQMVSFANDVLSDEGYIGSSVPLKRSVPVNASQLVSLGDQDLLSVQWGNGAAQLLGSLELAQPVNWLQAHGGAYWAMSDDYRRFYRYTDQYAMRPAQTWMLAASYFAAAVMDETQAIFYTTYTPSFQRLNLESGELQTPVEMDMTDVWFYRTDALLTADTLHFGELIQVDNTGCASATVCVLPSWTEWLASLMSAPKQWVLKSWPVEGGQSQPVVRSITGRPIAFTAEGLLITEEETLDGQLQLSLLSLSETAAHLVASAVLPCAPAFDHENNYLPYFADTQLVFDAAQDSLWLSCSGSTYYQMASPDFEAEEAQNVTRLYRLSPSQQFAVTGEWSFVGYKTLQMAADNTLMFKQAATTYFYPYTEAESFAGVEMQLMIWTQVENACQVVEVAASGQSSVLSEFDVCPTTSATVFSPSQAVFASGYAGLKTVGW